MHLTQYGKCVLELFVLKVKMHFALKFSSLSTVSASMYSSWWYWNASCMVAYLIRSAYTMGNRPILSPIEYNLPCCQYYSSTFIASNLIQKCINGVAFLQIILQLSSFINKCQQKRNNIELCTKPTKERKWMNHCKSGIHCEVFCSQTRLDLL